MVMQEKAINDAGEDTNKEAGYSHKWGMGKLVSNGAGCYSHKEGGEKIADKNAGE